MASEELPAGFRFCPTDEELIMDYLQNMVDSKELPSYAVRETNLYEEKPEDITERFKVPNKNKKEWYFFTPRQRKYPNGDRPSRKAGLGYWKATGADKPINDRYARKIGVKKSLVYYAGSTKKGTKTNWMMHEYRLLDSKSKLSKKSGSMRLDNCVLCRIYKKMHQAKKASTIQTKETKVRKAKKDSTPHSRETKMRKAKKASTPRSRETVPPIESEVQWSKLKSLEPMMKQEGAREHEIYSSLKIMEPSCELLNYYNQFLNSNIFQDLPENGNLVNLPNMGIGPMSPYSYATHVDCQESHIDPSPVNFESRNNNNNNNNYVIQSEQFNEIYLWSPYHQDVLWDNSLATHVDFQESLIDPGMVNFYSCNSNNNYVIQSQQFNAIQL